ncbi:hypothetical protein EYC84_006916 [Monilinia fructicola]|uniref:Uncharacterized protein n=1 Tax=Monilinia fructicola TaxID=38448 RepID=A0A5M9K4Y4_MONFR|nr:hypothetical protein EYC84_006916 [Monilinia fructicola]
MWPATTDAISDSSNCASLRTQVYLDPAIFVEHQSGEPFKCLIPSSLTAFHRLHFTTAPAVAEGSREPKCKEQVIPHKESPPNNARQSAKDFSLPHFHQTVLLNMKEIANLLSIPST